MRFRLLIFALLSASLAVGVAAVPRPGGLGTVGGQVVDASGKPIADARVTLQASERGHLETAETNTQGHFWFASLPEGQYAVRAYYQGRVSEWRQNVWVTPGQQINVTLHLHPKKSNLNATDPSVR